MVDKRLHEFLQNERIYFFLKCFRFTGPTYHHCGCHTDKNKQTKKHSKTVKNLSKNP